MDDRQGRLFAEPIRKLGWTDGDHARGNRFLRPWFPRSAHSIPFHGILLSSFYMHISFATRSLSTAHSSCASLANPFDVSPLSLTLVVDYFKVRVKHSCRGDACLCDLGVHPPCVGLVDFVVRALRCHVDRGCVLHVAA